MMNPEIQEKAYEEKLDAVAERLEELLLDLFAELLDKMIARNQHFHWLAQKDNRKDEMVF